MKGKSMGMSYEKITANVPSIADGGTTYNLISNNKQIFIL